MITGSWSFDLNKHNQNPFDVLYKVMEILYNKEILIPQFIYKEIMPDIKLSNGTFKELFSQIIEQKRNNDQTIYGNTHLYINKGEEYFERIIMLDYRIQNENDIYIYIYTLNQVWLPMEWLPIKESNGQYDFIWNIERYKLNNVRLYDALCKIDKVACWDITSRNQIMHNDFGSLQIGYKLFLSPEVIGKECKYNPNPEFDLHAYLEEIKNAYL